MNSKQKFMDNILCGLVYSAYLAVITVMVGLTCWVGLNIVRGLFLILGL